MTFGSMLDKLHGRWQAHRQRHHDLQAWAAASNLTDLGTLTADWLTGRITTHPGYYGGGPDPETQPIAGTLARACHAGLVTTNSQPATAATGIDGRWWRQRAWVEGLATPETAQALKTALSGSGLVVIVRPTPRTRQQWPQAHESALPITSVAPSPSEEGAVVTWGGVWLTARQVQGCFDGNATADVDRACQVTLVDPDWSGHSNRLWTFLDRFAETS